MKSFCELFVDSVFKETGNSQERGDSDKMTTQEFKAWFAGFCDGIDGSPTLDQWDRLKAHIAEIDEVGRGRSWPSPYFYNPVLWDTPRANVTNYSYTQVQDPPR